MKLFRKTVDESGNVAEYGAYVDERETVQYYYCERGRPAHALLPCARACFWGRKKRHRSSALLVFQVGRETEEGGGVEEVLLLFWNCFGGGGCVGRGGREGWGEIIAVSIRTRKKIRR